MADVEKLSMDEAAQEMIKKAQAEGVETIFDRAEKMKPCPIGVEGACCRIAPRAPAGCRRPRRNPGKNCRKKRRSAWACAGPPPRPSAPGTLPAWWRRGPAAHSDHARGVAKMFIEVAKGKAQGYQIKDVTKLKTVARDWDIATTVGEGEDAEPRPVAEIALEVGHRSLAEFGQQEGEIINVKRAPKKRLEIWRKEGVVPRGVDIEVVELMHRTHMGVDQDVPQPHQAVHPLRPGGRLGRLHDQHRSPGHPLWLPDAHCRGDQPGGPEGRPRQRHHARP